MEQLNKLMGERMNGLMMDIKWNGQKIDGWKDERIENGYCMERPNKLMGDRMNKLIMDIK